MSLRDLFHQSRKFGLVKDLVITDRSSSEQSERQRRHPRLALLEFRDKWSATKWWIDIRDIPFFEGIEVKPFFFNLWKNHLFQEKLWKLPLLQKLWKLQLFHQKSWKLKGLHLGTKEEKKFKDLSEYNIEWVLRGLRRSGQRSSGQRRSGQ